MKAQQEASALEKLLRQYDSKEKQHHFNDSYLGSTHTFYGVPVPVRRQLIKEWMKANKDASPTQVRAVVEALISGDSHEEKTMGAILLAYHKEARSTVTFAKLSAMLEKLVGWAEIDAFCYNVFSAEEMLADWKHWNAFLIKLSKDTNINKRRASLVYMTKPTSKSDDVRLHTLAYEIIDVLKSEKDILITKAISWLLRSMADTQPREVAAYLDNNMDSLPKIVIRETRKKIKTGKKN